MRTLLVQTFLGINIRGNKLSRWPLAKIKRSRVREILAKYSDFRANFDNFFEGKITRKNSLSLFKETLKIRKKSQKSQEILRKISRDLNLCHFFSSYFPIEFSVSFDQNFTSQKVGFCESFFPRKFIQTK